MNSEGASIPMGPNGSHSDLIYLVGMGYESQIGSRYPFVHKGILVIMQDCTRVSKQSLWIELID